MLTSKDGFIFVDNSRMSEGKRCPAAFYLHYVKHYVPDKIRMPLIFGSCWHKAMDAIFDGYYNKDLREIDLIQHAMDAFVKGWLEHGLPNPVPLNQLSDYKARHPATAQELLHSYVKKWSSYLEKHTLIAIEQPFAIPLDPENNRLFFVGRIDKIMKNTELETIHCLEHKTTTMYSKEFGFRWDFTEKWKMDSQLEGYKLFLRSRFSRQFTGTFIDATLVHKSEFSVMQHIPFARADLLTNRFVSDTIFWLDILRRCEEENFFPRNTSSCAGEYGICDFWDICLYVQDIIKLDAPPTGFIVEKWEPFNFAELEALLMHEENIAKLEPEGEQNSEDAPNA